MKSRYVAFVVATGCILAGLSAMAITPSEVGSAMAPGASASAWTKKKRPAPPAPLESQSIPNEPSPRPTLEEWQNATPVAVARQRTTSGGCRFFLVREWLKVKCNTIVAAIRQHGGSPEHVFFWVGEHDGSDWNMINGGEAMFPLRMGDQRVIEFYGLFPETCVGRQALPWLIIDETWVEGDASPTVVIR